MDELKCIEILESRRLNDIVSYLKNEEDFESFQSNLVNFRDTAFFVDLNMLAHSLLAESVRIGAAKVTENLSRFIASDKIPGIEILALNGIEIDEPIQISTDIRLIPFKEIPDSYWKAIYDITSVAEDFATPMVPRELLRRRTPGFLVPNAQKLPKPSVALVCDLVSYPKFISNSNRSSDKKLQIESRVQELIALSSCLTLVGPSSPSPIVYWWQAEEWVINLFTQAVSSTNFIFDLINQTNISYNSPAEKEKCKAICSAFLELSAPLKEKMHIPLDRLNRSIRRKELVDKAIELGVAMEAIFLTGDGEDSGELSFRLRLRAAWLLGANYHERQEIMKIFTKLYNYRSEAVHNGKIRGDNAEVSKNIDEGINWVANAIEKIMTLDAWPDWKAITLGNLLA